MKTTKRRAVLAAGACVAIGCGAAGQTTDLAEGNAAHWGTFASDGEPASIVVDAARVKEGGSALLFTTASGFDTGVRYPATGALNWNLTGAGLNFLFFWAFGENTTPIGWQGDQPVVVLRTLGPGGGSFTYTPRFQAMSNFAWTRVKIPLSGDENWDRTVEGTPSLSDVDVVEIHQDTWDAGFRVWYDGVRFASFTPGGLPPGGPPPPAGVDADAISPRVLLYIINPVMTNFGGQRMTQVYGWGDPVALTNQVIADLEASSHGRAKYRVVETIDDPTFPFLEDGFQYTPASFHAAWTGGNLRPGTFDYARFIAEKGLGPRVDAGEIDEVWVYAFPGTGMWESAMAGRGAYWINGVPYPQAGGERAFVVMGWNFERGVGEAIHSFGHRSESILADRIYGQWCQASACNTWSRFALIDQNAPGLGNLGNVHFPVNGQSDYDYGNARFVLSNADGWLTYPAITVSPRSVNFTEWSPTGQDTQRDYLNWWYRHMPHARSKGPDQRLANWWRYLLDVDQFKGGSASLLYATGELGVRLTSPSNGASVQAGTVVRVRADAAADGALGRVDFYVDGVYRNTDTLAPFWFDWSTAGLTGTHTLQARAYELQNGSEAVGPAVTVTIVPACPADFNGDGVLTPADIFAFLNAFFANDPRADFDNNGVRQPQDVFAFLGAYFARCP